MTGSSTSTSTTTSAAAATAAPAAAATAPAGRTDPLAAVNPLGLCLAAFLYSLPLLTSVDIVSAGTALGVWLVLFTALGITPATIVKRTWPLLLAAPLSGLSMLLYANPGGTVHFTWWLVTVSDNSIELALAITVRVLAIGVPTLVALVGIDPTRLADALAQIARLPARFVLGALAAVRLAGVLAADHRSLAQARRARGLSDTRSLTGVLALAFALLVTAMRRGTMLATAMEARAFGSGERTWARESRLTRRDAVVVALALGIALAAVGLAVATGTYRLVGSGGGA